MDDASVIGSLLRRPGPPAVLAPRLDVMVDDERLLAALDPAVPLLCLYEHCTFAEGTVWDAGRRRLVWSDVPGRRVLAWREDGQVETVVDATPFINGNAVDRDGSLLHCEHGRRCLSRSVGGRSPAPFLTHHRGRRFNGPNDLVFAPDGVLWFTDPTYALEMPEQGSLRERELDHASAYRVDPRDGSAERVADFEQPNGIALSPDGRTLYVSDTSRGCGGERHEIVAFDLAADGGVSGRRVLCEVDPGIPDGFTVDRRGWIWTSSGSGIQIFGANGRRLGAISTPSSCSNCDLDEEGGRLFVAAERTLLSFAIRPRASQPA